MRSSLPINAELSELVVILNSHNIEFLIVDEHALAFHGIPRFTEDIDFFINTTQSNVSRLAVALNECGITLDETGQQSFVNDERGMIVIGREPNRADFLIFLSGLDFEKAWKNRHLGELAGQPVFFLCKEDYRITKIASGRPKDIADLALLDASQLD